MNMKYEKPELEELELILEGSFLASTSVTNPGVDVGGGEGGDGGDESDWD